MAYIGDKTRIWSLLAAAACCLACCYFLPLFLNADKPKK